MVPPGNTPSGDRRPRLRASHSTWYAALGALTSFGAPAGLLLLRALSGAVSSVESELSVNWVTYVYVLAASAVAFTIFGFILGRKTDAFQQLSLRDPLTDLLNRRAIQDQFEREWRRAERYGQPLSLLLADLDRFKQINDTRGHNVGDRVIRATAAAIRETLRCTDFGGRWGGDEFAILAPNTSREAASRLAERLAVRIAEKAGSCDPRAGASIGIATVDAGRQGLSRTALLEEADRALYAAKAGGESASDEEAAIFGLPSDEPHRPNVH